MSRPTSPFLVALIVLIMPLITLAAERANEKPAPASRPVARKDVDAEQFARLRADKKLNAVVLDVRTKEEYDAGHIPGAFLIDVKAPDFDKKVADLPKGKTYLVHCRSGRRSVTACDKMSAIGFGDCYNLLGGIEAWEKAGKEVAKADAPDKPASQK